MLSAAPHFMVHPLAANAEVLADSIPSALFSSPGQFQEFFDALPLAIGLLDTEGRFTLANPSLRHLLERPNHADLIGKKLEELLTSELSDLVKRHFEACISGQTVEYEYLDLHTVPGPRWRRIRLLPQKSDQALAKGVFVIALDIHNEKIATQEIEARERQLHEFADNIPDPLAYIDATGCFSFVNRAFALLLAKSPEYIVNQPLEVFCSHPLLGDHAYSHFNQVRYGKPLVEERLLHDAKNAPVWIEVHWLPDQNSSRQPQKRGAYLICHDVTAAKEARALRERAIAETEKTLNSIHTPVAIVDAQLKFRFANKSLLDWYRLEREQLLGHHVQEIMDPKHYQQSLPYIERALNGEEVSFMREFPLPDGTSRWVKLVYIPHQDEHGPNGFYVVAVDIHDLETQQQLLRSQQEELRRTSWLLSSHLENSPLAAIELDADLCICRWSERAKRVFGWPREEVLGRSIWDLGLVSPDESDALGRSLGLVLTIRQQRASSLQRITRRDGVKLWCEWYLSALLDEQGELISIFALVHDVNQRVETEARLQQLAIYDALTGLMNRSTLQFELVQALERAQRYQMNVAALFIDLDHFKNINDTLGHKVGDQLLVTVAKILKACVRKHDIVSRMGGDEFMLVIQDRDVKKASEHIALKVLASLNQPIPVEHHMLTVAASIGIAIAPEHGHDADTLLKNSDVAMYHAKQGGKGRFEFYSSALAKVREEQSVIEFSLRGAMANQQLALHYQPRVWCHDGRIEGAEVLLRWQHPELGNIAPKKFIQVAEETGLIFELGTWLFRRACEQLQAWQESGLRFQTLSINFSARQLLMNDLVERIGRILRETRCNPRLIEVEITETSMLFDVNTTRKVVSALKKLGLRIAIDDFGTGFSSLSHLQQLDIDALKIDQSFVEDLLHDSGDAAITRTVINLGRGLGLQVIAEGVENARQLAFLQNSGCDLYQGYHFSPALEAKQFEALFKQPHSSVVAASRTNRLQLPPQR